MTESLKQNEREHKTIAEAHVYSEDCSACKTATPPVTDHGKRQAKIIELEGEGTNNVSNIERIQTLEHKIETLGRATQEDVGSLARHLGERITQLEQQLMHTLNRIPGDAP